MNRQQTKDRLGLILILIALAFAGSRFMGTRAFAQAGGWTYTGNLQVARMSPLVTRLKDGRVLVAGGYRYDSQADDYLWINSSEIFDPTLGTWSLTGNIGGINSSATVLANGKVLALGQGVPTQLYDPESGTWTNTSDPSLVFGGHREVALPDGRLLMVGGYRAEIYDPNSGVWSMTTAPRTPRFGHTLTILANGKVLLAGGSHWFNYPPHSLTSTEIYDPANGTWNYSGNLNTGREGHAAGLLSNGMVLIAGGSICGDSSCSLPLKSAELYDPATGLWTNTGNLNTPRAAFTFLSLANGKAFASGPYSDTETPEIYDFAAGTWTRIPTTNRRRYGAALIALANSNVLSAGGETCNSDSCDADNTAEIYDPNANTANEIDNAEFFVRQHYRDFLNREPDAEGLAFWINEINSCGVAQCIDAKRINVSAAYFLSIEFQQTGYLVYRTYKASYGNLTNAPVPIKLSEFLPDTQQIGNGVIVNQAGWEQLLETNKQNFFSAFVQRSRFTSAYPNSLTPDQFIGQLFVNAGVVPLATDRAAAINEFGGAMTTGDVAARARALRRVAENSTLAQQEFNRAFVLMQYFGYLRRNPNDPPEATMDFQGYNFWLNKLNQFNGNFVDAEMVKAFLVSIEYRQRFGQP